MKDVDLTMTKNKVEQLEMEVSQLKLDVENLKSNVLKSTTFKKIYRSTERH